MAIFLDLDKKSLQPFQNAAGHGGVMSDSDGEVIVKPCTQAEVDFYQETIERHPSFTDFMPAFIGTLNLGLPDPATITSDVAVAFNEALAKVDVGMELPKAQGKKIAAETAIVLENLEHGFIRPSVVDIKLGAKLYAPGTAAEKAARLDKVAAETTSGSLNFRIAGMKVWNPLIGMYDIYDKQYGRKFDEKTVIAGFKSYFDALMHPKIISDLGKQVISAVLAELIDARTLLEKQESRFYSSSVLIVFEGDPEVLRMKLLESADEPEPRTSGQRQPKLSAARMEADDYDDDDDDHDDEDDDESDSIDDLPVFRLKLIDFAHSTWCPGQGKDMNVITGLVNIEKQIQKLLDTMPTD